ncbi:hypothetical protein CBL_08027 [Carabus blaptoides fortunei]
MYMLKHPVLPVDLFACALNAPLNSACSRSSLTEEGGHNGGGRASYAIDLCPPPCREEIATYRAVVYWTSAFVRLTLTLPGARRSLLHEAHLVDSFVISLFGNCLGVHWLKPVHEPPTLVTRCHRVIHGQLMNQTVARLGANIQLRITRYQIRI